MPRLVITATLLLAASSMPALAHLAPENHGSFASGLTHPISGLDHILAMVTVGLWASMSGGRATWIVPAAFVAMMGTGFLFAMAGLSLPFVEPMILASIVVLGLLVAIAWRAPVLPGMVIVGLFAIFHGYAHGSELGSATPFSYAAGFMVATAILHAVGIGLGIATAILIGALRAPYVLRPAGAAVAAAGLVLAIGL